MIRRVLEQSSFRFSIEEAGDGAAALERCRATAFDVVFLDCGMPDPADVDRALHTALGLKLPQLIATWTPPAKRLQRRKPVEFCPMDASGEEDTSLHFVDEAWLDAIDETEPARD